MGKVSMDLAMVHGGWQYNSTTAHCEKTCERPGMDMTMVAVGSITVQPHCEKTWERSGMDLAMIAVSSVIVQQRTVRKHGCGWQYISTTVAL